MGNKFWGWLGVCVASLNVIFGFLVFLDVFTPKAENNGISYILIGLLLFANAINVLNKK